MAWESLSEKRAKRRTREEKTARLREQGASWTDVAEKLGVSRRTVSRRLAVHRKVQRAERVLWDELGRAPTMDEMLEVTMIDPWRIEEIQRQLAALDL